MQAAWSFSKLHDLGMSNTTLLHISTDDTEESRLKLFEGDILLVEREQYRERRSNKQVTSSNQEASTMRTGDNTEYSHIWQNRIVYYKFGLTLSEFNNFMHACTGMGIRSYCSDY